MNESRFQNNSQLAIKAVCIVGLINISQMMTLIFSPTAKHIGAFFPAYFTVSVVISMACLGGLWFLRKWAASLYAAVLLCNQFVLMATGFWEITASIIPLAVIFLLYRYKNEMT